MMSEPTRLELTAQINAERERQILVKGYTYDHDDQHGAGDWLAFIVHELGQIDFLKRSIWTIAFRRQMFKVAALALAALEWSYR